MGKLRKISNAKHHGKPVPVLDSSLMFGGMVAGFLLEIHARDSQTTTCSSSGGVSGNKRRPRSQAKARKPNHQK